MNRRINDLFTYFQHGTFLRVLNYLFEFREEVVERKLSEVIFIIINF